MSLKSKSLVPLLVALTVGFCSCTTGTDTVRVTHSKNSQYSVTSAQVRTAESKATIVHINETDRLATIRNGNDLPADFLITKNQDENPTGILKARSPRKFGLRTADIIEGRPAINDTITPADVTENTRLEKMYPPRTSK